MDDIFNKYSAKLENDKVTEWDSNLLFPDWYAPTNPLDYTRLQTLFVSWNFVIPDNHWLLLSQRGIQNGKGTQKIFEFFCASITLIYQLFLNVLCHRSFSLPKKCPNKMDIVFDIYNAKVDNYKLTAWDSNLLFLDWYALTNPLDYRLCSLAEIWIFQTITNYFCHKGAFKTVKIRTNTMSFTVRA